SDCVCSRLRCLLPRAMCRRRSLFCSAICLILPSMFFCLSLTSRVADLIDLRRETGENWDKEIAQDTAEECGKFGTVQHVHVDRNSRVRSQPRVLCVCG